MVRGGQDGRGARGVPPGALIAAGTVLLLAVVALLLRPKDRLLEPGNGPLGDRGILVVGLVVVWALGLTSFTKRLRGRIRTDDTTTHPAAERLRQAALPLLLAGPLALGILALVLHRFTPSPSPARPAPVPTAPPVSTGVMGRPPKSSENSDPSWPLYVLLGLAALAVLTVLVIVLVRRLRGWKPALIRPDALAADDDDAERDRRLLLSAVRSGHRALAEGEDARAAVIACYAAMEEALAVSGVARRASDSPADLLTRATRAGLATGSAAPRLTALFREARYSSHPMDGTQRAAAADALEEIADQLRDREAAR
ncbi:DUF4129 domain-containing protein [Streptomyces sp. NPDC016845]|uniref:DUF4129 domain-containing protein n=1 Tax=Streptomyces sp. NPDC016845 TaxID=3364972 RepID=UPI00378B66E1